MASIAQILELGRGEPIELEQQRRQQQHEAQLASERLRRARERLTLERERVLHETERRKEQEAQRDALDDQTIQQARVQAQGDPDKFLKAISGVRPKLFIAEAEETRKMKKAIDDSDIAALDIANKEIERSAAELAGLAAFPEAEQAAIYEERFQRQIKAGQFPAKFDLKAINTLMGRAELGRKMAQLKIDQDREKREADTLALRTREYENPKLAADQHLFLQAYYAGKGITQPTGQQTMEGLEAWKKFEAASVAGRDVPLPEDVLTQQILLRKVSQSADQGKSTLMMVPAPGGGYQAREVRPGQTVPEGAVSPGGLSSMTVPTAATRTMMEAAPKVRDFTARLLPQIDAQEASLGPAASRWAEFMTGKVGAPNPEFTKLRVNIGLLQTLLMRMHVGARGGMQMMEHFRNLIDAGKQSPENLRAALIEIDAYADSVAQSSGAAGARTGRQGPAVGTIEDGYRFKGGDPAKQENWERVK